MPALTARRSLHHGRRQSARESTPISLPLPSPPVPTSNSSLIPPIQAADHRSSSSPVQSPSSPSPSLPPPEVTDASREKPQTHVDPPIKETQVMTPSPEKTQTTTDQSPEKTQTLPLERIDPSREEMQMPTNNGGGWVQTEGGPEPGNGDLGQSMHTIQSIPGSGDVQNDGVVTGTSSGIGLAPATTRSPNSVVTPFSISGNFSADRNTPQDAGNDPSDSSSSNSGSRSASAPLSTGNGNGDPGEKPSSGSGNGPEGSDSGNRGLSSGNRSSDSGNGDSMYTRISTGAPSGTGVPTAAVVPAGDDGNRNGDTISTGGVQEHGLSGGAIAGIVIAVFVVAIAVTVILLRRRFKKHRGERRKRWWLSHDKATHVYGDRGGEICSRGGIAGVANEQRQSFRSSFETTVDHSLTPRLDEDLDFPSFPPMAELRGTSLLDNSFGPATLSRLPSVKGENRFSGATFSSISSDGHSQWLVINEDHLAPEISSPMSVRPFSPTETFAFPRPPTEKNSSDWGLNFSRPPSSYTSNTSIAEEKVPALPVPAANPFNDPSPLIIYSTAAATRAAITNIGSSDAPLHEAVANNSMNPFADPVPCTINSEFMKFESIKRPFNPSLDDELAVIPGDKVRILQLFDDGWALVEKNPCYGPASVKGKGRESEQGLIPIDCLRLPGVESLELVASKRVSSFS